MDGKGHALRQYYVAVSSMENKLATLIDLLRAFDAAAPLSVVVCCGSRHSLDAVSAAAVAVPHCRVWVLHADMSEREVEATVHDYQAAIAPLPELRRQDDGQPPAERQQPMGNAAEEAEEQQQEPPRRRRGLEGEGEASSSEAVRLLAAAKRFVGVLAATDAGMRPVPKEALPLGPTLLISYDLPARKEAYLRRISSVLGSRSRAGGQRIAVNFAVAGQLEEFRQVEEFSEKPIEEMPVHVSDIFAQ